MKKITINIIAEDHNNVRREAEGSMLVSDKEYDYFLKDANEMLYHCSQQQDAVDRICKTAFANIDSEYNLKNIVERCYSEDGKLRSLSVASYLKGDEWDSSSDSDPYTVQNNLCKILEMTKNKFTEEKAVEKK